MTAKDLIAHDIPSLNFAQTGKEAFHLLNDHHLKHLPVVEDGRLVGIISEADIFNHKLYEPIGAYDFSMARRFAVRDGEHVLEVIKVMGDHRLTIIPVLDSEGFYLGVVTQNDLLRFFSATASFTQPGAVLVLEMERRDYSMATIARFVEENECKILCSFVTSTHESETLEVTLKLNSHDVSRVIASLERHNYTVRQTFGEPGHADNGLQDRVDSLMNYLNM